MKLKSRKVIEYGIDLPWKKLESTGPMTARDGRVWYEDHPPKGTVLDRGIVFIKMQTLEELMEAENSWGMGGAFLLHSHEALALEQKGWATRETRGGYHSTDEQRKKLGRVIDDLYRQREKERT